jgi:hypothetical protein
MGNTILPPRGAYAMPRGGEKLDADVVEWVLSAKEQFEETVNA